MAHESTRPLLLPHNRRIRHLQGVYLRNLTFTRPRGHTIDDATLNKSPAKLEALREPQLHHAQSSDALNEQIRPGKARRRSTVWAGQSPGYRQKKLEDVIDGGMADTFFSLHCEGVEEPIFISEVVKKAMNPTFRFFDLSKYGPSVRRLSSLTIKVWAKRHEFTLLLEKEICLSSLNFIGSLENKLLPPNSILFHLIDGIYAMDLPASYSTPKPAPSLPTSSYSALMRLSSLDESIQDALATRESIASQINAMIKEIPPAEVPQAEDEAVLASKYVITSRKLLKASLRRRTELLASLGARRQAIEDGIAAQNRAQSDVDGALDKLAQCRSLLNTTTSDIHNQRRRICEELMNIFPIEPTDQPLQFTICNLSLPNTSFDDSDADTLSAALGHVARLVDMLQYYLSVPLPYPVTAYGSRSIIRDQISTLADAQRTFPLYMKGTVRFRFDYGVFLLNKDIECLAESQGLKVIDIRHTLPNLKYLLYVCSAGSSELPSRKAGGIRGLLAGRVNSPMERTDSEESITRKRSSLNPNSDGNGNSGRDIDENAFPTILPFRDDGGTTLRTRGLRENVVR